MANIHMVTMGEICVSKDPQDVLVALGLGSCVGLCAYDARHGIAGMAHLILPTPIGQADGGVGKYASVGVPALIDEMLHAGAAMTDIRTAIIGGAHLFATSGSENMLAIGTRNVEATLSALDELGIRPIVQETGGGNGRTIHLFAFDGKLRLKTLGKGETELAVLGGHRHSLLECAA